MASPKDSASPPPAPVIGKIGPYTVFLAPPPSSPKSPPSAAAAAAAAPTPIPQTPKKVAARPPVPRPFAPPPVLAPPAQFTKPSPDHYSGFFRNAVSKVQNAHSSLDEYVAGWLGLNQSKYQWALDDYYESKGLQKEDAKTNEVSSKSQCV